MGKIVGYNGTFGVDDSAATCRALSGDGNSVTMSWTADAPEVTAFGDSTRQRLPDGLKDVSFDYSAFFSTTATTGVDAVLSGILGGSSRVVWGPNGSASGEILYSACVVCTDYGIDHPVDGVVTVTATFANRSGSLTRGTWT